jgi:hypothetical protein
VKENTEVTKIKLKILERIHVGHLMPEKGGLATMLTRKSIVDKVIITEKDVKAVEWKDLDNGQAKWNEKKDTGRVFSFTGLETELIVRQLRKLNEEEAITDSHLPLWGLFVEKND